MKIGIMGLGVMAGLFLCLLMVSMMPATAESQKVVAIEGGGRSSSMALLDDGTVWVWGYNYNGVLGGGTTQNQYAPVKVDITNVKAIANGMDYMLAVKDDGTVWGWGLDSDGNLGKSSEEYVLSPIKINGIDNVAKIDAYSGQCFALKNDGSVWAWGRNDYGELGIGKTSSGHTITTPIQVNISNVKDIACLFGTTFVLKNDGTLWAAGDGEYGLLGRGNTEDSNIFVQEPITNVTAIGCGYGHILAVKEDGTLWSWGTNWDYQTGSISDHDYQSVPTQVPYIDNVKAVSGGFGNSLALKNDGTVWVWGLNQMSIYGIGSISGEDSMYPVKVDGLDNVVAISSGDKQNFAIKNDGTLWGWGDDHSGSVGVGSILQNWTNHNSYSVVRPTQILFDQPDRIYEPYYPSMATPTPAHSIDSLHVNKTGETLTENILACNKSAQYIAVGDNGTLYVFDNNTIDRYDGSGKLLWSMAIPDQWNIIKYWNSAVYFKISRSQGGSLTPYPIYDINDGYLYLYGSPNAATQNFGNGYSQANNYDQDCYSVIAISPDGKIAWTLPLTADNTATEDAAIKATVDRIYIFHGYNETVLDKSGKVLFNIPNVSDPAAIDEHGNLYVTPARSRYWPTNQYPIAGKDIYADFRTPSNSIEAYTPDGGLLWHKEIDMTIERQYVADDIRAKYGTSPLYQDDTLYVMNERQIMAMDLNGNVIWTKIFGEGLYVLFDQMPTDSHDHLYLTSLPLTTPDPVYDIRTTLRVIGPDGNDVCPSRDYRTSNDWAAYDGVLYNVDRVGITDTSRDSFKTLGNDSLYDLPTSIITAYDIINDTVLWQYETSVSDKHEIIVDAANVRSILEPQFSYNITSMFARPGEDIQKVLSSTWIMIYPANDVVYISFMSTSVEVPIVLGKSRAVYSSGIYALDSNGMPVFVKPTSSFASLFAGNNSTIYFMTGDGKISSLGIGIAVAGGIAILAIAAIAAKFFLFGSVTRARKRVDKNENRNVVLQFIVENPGVTMYDIAKRLNMNRGTVRYHLFILSMNHKIATFKDGELFVRYFTNSNRYSHDEQLIISLMRRDTMSKILGALRDSPALTNLDICAKTGLADSTVSKFVKELFEKGVVSKELVAAGRFAYHLTEKSGMTLDNLEKRFGSETILPSFTGSSPAEAL